MATLPAAPVPAEERTLTYWITVQKFRNGKPFRVVHRPWRDDFEDDYRIQIAVRSPQPGYLYIFSEGPPEGTAPIEFVLLFPSLTANKGSSLLASDQVVQIPKNLVSIRQRGRHRSGSFLRPTRCELDALGVANPETRGLITDAVQNKAIQSFLASHSAQSNAAKGNNQTIVKAPETSSSTL